MQNVRACTVRRARANIAHADGTDQGARATTPGMRNRRGASPALMLLVSVGCSRASERTEAVSSSPSVDASVPTVTTTSTAPPGVPLEVTTKHTGGRSHRVFSATRHRIALRLDRPRRSEQNVLLSVAGTYTSPTGAVEGFLMVDGEVKQSKPMTWAGRVVIVDGRARIERAARGAPLPTSKWKAASATVFQGHLLVHEGQAQPLKPSPLRQRRALVDLGRETAVVESVTALPLATFADDLVRLGAVAALNLDMGGWSEGWARLETGIVALGENHSQTQRQSNWVVVGR